MGLPVFASTPHTTSSTGELKDAKATHALDTDTGDVQVPFTSGLVKFHPDFPPPLWGERQHGARGVESGGKGAIHG